MSGRLTARLLTALAAPLYKQPYYRKVERVFGSSLVGYWPLGEASGTTVHDFSPHGLDGSSNGPAVNQPGIGDGFRSYSFDATNDTLSVFSAALVPLFSGSAGAVSVWFKVSGPVIWSDATFRRIFEFNVDADNKIQFLRSNANAQMYLNYEAGNVGEYIYLYGLSASGWIHVCCTWSHADDRVRLYLNGQLYRAAATGLGDWAGDLASAVIGYTAGGTSVWGGCIAQLALGDRELTPAEVRRLAQFACAPRLFSVLGDSISANANNWIEAVVGSYPGGYRSALANHAVAGHSIMANLADQVSAAATDNARVILLHLGTNDDNSGDMGDLQAEVEAALAALKASNPLAILYYMNVLPRWTDPSGVTEVDKSNIRAAIAAACTAQAVACWDTYTDPWITAAQTSDGEHPTAAGTAAILSRVLGLL